MQADHAAGTKLAHRRSAKKGASKVTGDADHAAAEKPMQVPNSPRKASTSLCEASGKSSVTPCKAASAPGEARLIGNKHKAGRKSAGGHQKSLVKGPQGASSSTTVGAVMPHEQQSKGRSIRREQVPASLRRGSARAQAADMQATEAAEAAAGPKHRLRGRSAAAAGDSPPADGKASGADLGHEAHRLKRRRLAASPSRQVGPHCLTSSAALALRPELQLSVERVSR